jgi:hypothetical protein
MMPDPDDEVLRQLLASYAQPPAAPSNTPFVEPDPSGAVGGGAETAFQNWFGPVAQKLDLSPDPNDPENYYDYRGFYDAMKRGEVKSPDQPGGHWDSRFKDPNHPRAYLLDPETGRYFDTTTGNYTGGAREEVPYGRMDRLNSMDIQDLPHDQWLEAQSGADSPQAAKRAALQEALDTLLGRGQKSYR